MQFQAHFLSKHTRLLRHYDNLPKQQQKPCRSHFLLIRIYERKGIKAWQLRRLKTVLNVQKYFDLKYYLNFSDKR